MAMSDEPITPHATPLRDAAGRLTYIGEDGRRYVVAAPPPPQRPEAGEADSEWDPPGNARGGE
jgi:hypothetical protein